MLLYRDVVTGGEVCTDSFKKEESNDGVVWDIASKRVKVGDDGEVDIGCGSAFGGAGEEDGPADPNVVTEVDVLAYHKLLNVGYQKKEYKALMKMYWKNLKAGLEKRKEAAEESKIEAEIKEAKAAKKQFKKDFPALQEFVKKVIANFNDYEFYVCEKAQDFVDAHDDVDAPLIIPASYPDGALSPVFHVIVAGVYGQKF